jgi:PAS domain-containing protein
VNASKRDYASLTLEEARAVGWMSVIYPDDAPVVRAAWDAAMGAERPVEIEARHCRFDGAYRRFSIMALPRPRGPDFQLVRNQLR